MKTLARMLQTLQKTFLSWERQLEEGALTQLRPDEPTNVAPPIPTGSAALDEALGTGGWPRGRLVELLGPTCSGKSTLALHAVRACQERGGVACYLDVDRTFELRAAEAAGVRLEELLISQPETGETAMEIVAHLVRSELVALVVIDTVAALLPEAEGEALWGEGGASFHNRMMSRALRDLVGDLSQTDTTVLCLNQTQPREDPQKTPMMCPLGGVSLPFFASQRIALEAIRDEGGVLSVRALVIKNTLAPPLRSATWTAGEGTERKWEGG